MTREKQRLAAMAIGVAQPSNQLGRLVTPQLHGTTSCKPVVPSRSQEEFGKGGQEGRTVQENICVGSMLYSPHMIWGETSGLDVPYIHSHTDMPFLLGKHLVVTEGGTIHYQIWG